MPNERRIVRTRFGTARLIWTIGGWRIRPVPGDEVHAPEVRGRREKLQTDALAFVGGIAEIYDAAFLIFLGEGVGQDHHGIHFERLVEVKQAAVGINDDSLAGLAETP